LKKDTNKYDIIFNLESSKLTGGGCKSLGRNYNKHKRLKALGVSILA
jgi:hypothetical protein